MLIFLPASLFLLPTEAAFGDLQPVTIAVIPPIEALAAAIRAVKAIAALSTRAVSVGIEQEHTVMEKTMQLQSHTISVGKI